MTLITPALETDLSEAVAEAASAGTPLETRGGGTRAGLGRPVQVEKTLSTKGLSGITLYEPGALTLVVKAGTPVAEIEAVLAAEGQMLPFEPMDHRALLGTEGEPTIGGVVACGVSGPRRIQAGACRDAMLGVRFVNGRGDVVKSGGRVMKNVTGYDLTKLLCGSYGTLGVLSEISFKVQPKPEAMATLVSCGLDAGVGVAALGRAMGSPFAISGAAHLETGSGSRSLVRIEGLAGSVAYRTRKLCDLLGAGWAAAGEDENMVLWGEVRDVIPFAGRDGAVWRASVKPSGGPVLSAALTDAGLDHVALYDWGGGLVWVLTPENGDAGAGVIRREVAAMGGHASLIRASAATRMAVEVFQPEPEPLTRIAAGLRAKFDPAGVLNPGRMGG